MTYKSQQRKQDRLSDNQKPNSIDYSPSILEKALGFVRVFGLTEIPEGVKNVLNYAIRIGDLTQEQINFVQSRHDQEYSKNPLEKLFS